MYFQSLSRNIKLHRISPLLSFRPLEGDSFHKVLRFVQNCATDIHDFLQFIFSSLLNINVCCGSWHHKQFMVCDMETFEGQKTKVKIFGFIKTFCSLEGIYRYSLEHQHCL